MYEKLIILCNKCVMYINSVSVITRVDCYLLFVPQLQGNKQVLGQQREKLADIDSLRPQDPNQRNKASWTNDEQLLAVQGMQLPTYVHNFMWVCLSVYIVSVGCWLLCVCWCLFAFTIINSFSPMCVGDICSACWDYLKSMHRHWSLN